MIHKTRAKIKLISKNINTRVDYSNLERIKKKSVQKRYKCTHVPAPTS